MIRKNHLLIVLCFLCCRVFSQGWTINYRDGFPHGRIHFYDGTMDQEGVTFLAGEEGPNPSHPQLLLMRIEPDGAHNEFHYQRTNAHCKATSVIETSDHHLFVTGNLFKEDGDSLLVLLFDKELHLLGERCYGKNMEAGPFGNCVATCDPYGNVIVASTISIDNAYGGSENKGVLFKFNGQGTLLLQRYLIADDPDPLYYWMDFNLRQMWYLPESNRLLCLAPGQGNVMSFITFDDEFNYIEEHPIWRDDNDKTDHTLFRDCYTDHWYSNDKALFFSSRGDADHNKLRISVINTQGEFLQFIHLNERQDTIDDAARHRCMAKVNDSIFYFSFHSHTTGYFPGYACVYKINDRLEIVGRHIDDDHENYRSYMIFATNDGGCITVNDSCPPSGYANICHPVIRRLAPDDFESVPYSIIQSATIPTGRMAYPNPTDGLLNIPLTTQQPPTRFQLLDRHGRLITDRHINSPGDLLQLDVSPLPPGLYHYRLLQGEHPILQEKFIKK